MQNPCHYMASSQHANVTSYEVSKAIYTSGLLNKVKLSPTTKLVLIALSNHYNPSKKDMFPSIMYLANQLGISHSSVARAITELRNSGLIIYTSANTPKNLHTSANTSSSKTKSKVNRYKFTNLFFNILGVAQIDSKPCQNENSNHVKKTCKQIKEQKNKQTFFQKKSYNKVSNLPEYYSSNLQSCDFQQSLKNKQVKRPYENFNHINGVNYKPYKAAELIRNDKTPMNDKQTALKYIESFTNEELNNTFIKKHVNRIKQIWLI